jgi:hypothetical protein
MMAGGGNNDHISTIGSATNFRQMDARLATGRMMVSRMYNSAEAKTWFDSKAMVHGPDGLVPDSRLKERDRDSTEVIVSLLISIVNTKSKIGVLVYEKSKAELKTLSRPVRWTEGQFS